MKLLVIGVSSEPVCGVRDNAAALSRALETHGVELETVWLSDDSSTSLNGWADEAGDRGKQADAILWHYSVFAYSRRGIPIVLPAVVRRIERAERPTIGFLHELSYPRGVGGARGAVWAATQRLALKRLLRSLTAAVVTTPERAAEIRAVAPTRRVEFVPLFSSLPERNGAAPLRDDRSRVGVFGFRRDELPSEQIVVAAIAALRDRSVATELVLIGAPGAEGPAAERWRQAADTAGCAEAMSFTGIVGQQELSKELAALDVLLFTDAEGPTPRRSTLAAGLAYGLPVVAFDGPRRWDPFVEEGAVVVAERTSQSLAATLERLLGDHDSRAEQGLRARDFYDRRLAAALAAQRIVALVEATA